MRRYGVLVIGLVVGVVCARLGLWQLDRLAERRERNARIEARLALPAVELPWPVGLGAADADALAFRRARAQGTFDFGHELVVVGRSRRGVPGVHIVTPLRLAGGGWVLVERGWTASPDARRVDLAALTEPDVAVVTGILLPAAGARAPETVDADWPRYVRTPGRSAYPPALADSLPPLVLRRTEAGPDVPARLEPIPPPEVSDGPHLSYAMQWFAFAAIAMVGAVMLFRREGGKGNGEG